MVLQQHGNSVAHFLYDTGRTRTGISDSAKSYKDKIHRWMSGAETGPKTESPYAVSDRNLRWNRLGMANAPEWTPPFPVGTNTKWEFKCEGKGRSPDRFTVAHFRDADRCLRPTLRDTPHDVPQKTGGQDGAAVTFPVGLLHPLQHAGLCQRHTPRWRRSRPEPGHNAYRAFASPAAVLTVGIRSVTTELLKARAHFPGP